MAPIRSHGPRIDFVVRELGRDFPSWYARGFTGGFTTVGFTLTNGVEWGGVENIYQKIFLYTIFIKT